MTDDELCYLSATDLRVRLRAKEVSPLEVMDAVLDRLERVEPTINAFVTVLAERAHEHAHRATEELATTDPADLGALHGIPVAIKDLTPTAGVRTTQGSVQHAGDVADRDSIGWERIKAAGAILIGKTTTPDFGTLGVTDSTLTGSTRNPWDPSRTVGGSSGGSAAAMAAGVGHLAWGSDGGGSIRIPSACCGVVGLKCSIGRIPGEGELPSFEGVTVTGPITRTVADNALLLSVTAGPDPRDYVALPASDVSWARLATEASVAGRRIAYSPDLGQVLVSSSVRAAMDAAADTWRELGAIVDEVEIDLPDALEYFMAWWGPEYIGVVDETIRQGFGLDTLPPAVLTIAERARSIGVMDRYWAAMDTRARIGAEFTRVFSSYDLMITPTMPLTAFPHPGAAGGATHIDGIAVERPELYFHRMTEPFSHAGLPVISVPCGFDGDDLPVGMQIAGRQHDDAGVLVAAAAYEHATPWHLRRPPL